MRHRHIAAFVICAVALTSSNVDARAEGGIFGALFNLLRGNSHSSAPPSPNAATASDPWNFPANGTIVPSGGGPTVAYCVRTCDGRYFPLPKNAGGTNSTPAKVCNSMCPTAETKIFTGNEIESAASSDGKRYSSLSNAFVYRERLVGNCTCNGKDAGGNATIDIKSDPTLRAGDIVMTTNGPVVYKGNTGGAHRASDFVPAADSTKLSATTKSKVAGMKAMPGKQTVTVATSQKPVKTGKPDVNATEALTFVTEPTGPSMSFTTR